MKSGLAIRKPTQTARYDLSGGAIGTSAYVTILAKASNLYASSALEIFNPSPATMKIATGDAGSEVDLPYSVLPGGMNILAFEIPKGVRISMKAADQTSGAVGLVVINQFG